MAWTRTAAGVGTGMVLALAGGPLACGGDAFTAGAGDGGSGSGSGGGVDGAPVDGAAEGGEEGGSVEGGLDGHVPNDGPEPAEAGVTLHGVVVDQFLLPMSGTVVIAAGAAATTDSAGAFSLHGVPSPYTLVVEPPESGRKHVYIFPGGTRPDPTLQLLDEVSAPAHSVTFTGSEPGAGDPLLQGLVFADFATGSVGVAGNSATVSTNGTAFSGTASWLGPGSAMGSLYSLEWFTSGASVLPTGYKSFASGQFTFATSTISWPVPQGQTVSAGSIDVTANAGTGYALADVALYARPPGSNVAAPIVHDRNPPLSTVTFVTPNISGFAFDACGVQGLVTGTSTPNPPFGLHCRTGLAATMGATLMLPTAPTLVSPPSTAGVGTTFTWNAMGNAVYTLAFEPATVGAGPSIYLITSATTAPLPDLTTLGVVLPKSTSYTATVYGFAPYGGLDDALGPSGYAGLAVGLRSDHGPAQDGAFGFSGATSFTTK